MLHFTPDTWINVASVVITSASIVLAIIFYRRTIQKRVPTYGVHPLRVRIVDKSLMTVPTLEISHSGQPLGAHNVTAVTVYFWNAGRAPIHRNDVLETYKISLAGEANILDRKIVSTTRAVCNFALARGERPHETTLTFTIVEQWDGVAIQFIYTGDPDSAVKIEGVTEGVRMFNTTSPIEQEPESSNYGCWWVPVALIAIAALIDLFYLKDYRLLWVLSAPLMLICFIVSFGLLQRRSRLTHPLNKLFTSSSPPISKQS